MSACYLCKHDTSDRDSVLWVLHDGRLVEVCGVCLDRIDRDEPVDERLDMTEEVAP